MINKINVKINSLPPLPDSVKKIEELYKENGPNLLNDIASVIEKDPFLTVDLMKIANSPYYGFQSKIESVKRIVSLFGIEAVRAFVVSHAFKKSAAKDLSTYNLTIEDLMSYIQKKEIFFKIWEKEELHGIDPEKYLKTLIFIEDIGKVVLQEVIEEEKELLHSFKKEIKENPDKVEQIEKKYIGYTTHEVTYHILRHWKFGEIVYEPIRLYAEEKDSSLYPNVLKVINKTIMINGEVNKESGLKEVEKHNFSIEAFCSAIDKYLDIID